jgi:hypothetical protein
MSHVHHGHGEGDEGLEGIARFVGHVKAVDHRRLCEAPRAPARGRCQAGSRSS